MHPQQYSERNRCNSSAQQKTFASTTTANIDNYIFLLKLLANNVRRIVYSSLFSLLLLRSSQSIAKSIQFSVY